MSSGVGGLCVKVLEFGCLRASRALDRRLGSGLRWYDLGVLEVGGAMIKSFSDFLYGLSRDIWELYCWLQHIIKSLYCLLNVIFLLNNLFFSN